MPADRQRDTQIRWVGSNGIIDEPPTREVGLTVMLRFWTCVASINVSSRSFGLNAYTDVAIVSTYDGLGGRGRCLLLQSSTTYCTYTTKSVHIGSLCHVIVSSDGLSLEERKRNDRQMPILS